LNADRLRRVYEALRIIHPHHLPTVPRQLETRTPHRTPEVECTPPRNPPCIHTLPHAPHRVPQRLPGPEWVRQHLRFAPVVKKQILVQ
jgi:hypothetical protein